jgi:hypothetical protein
MMVVFTHKEIVDLHRHQQLQVIVLDVSKYPIVFLRNFPINLLKAYQKFTCCHFWPLCVSLLLSYPLRLPPRTRPSFFCQPSAGISQVRFLVLRPQT